MEHPNGIGSGIITILVAIIGVATIAVIVSNKSGTSGVIKSAGDALGGLLKIAVSPVS